VGINARWPPHDDPRWSITADDRARLGEVLDAILTSKSAEAAGAAMLAALNITRPRGRPGVHCRRTTVRKNITRPRGRPEKVDAPNGASTGLRDRLYADRALSDSYTVPLIEVLDAIAAGGTARAIGDRVLALFGGRRGRGRPRNLAARDAEDLAWNLYRLGTPIREIADATGWTIGSVERFLNPLIAAFGSVRPRQPTKQPPKRPR